MVILYCLMEFEVVRFNELRRYLKNVSDKTLSNNLKELEKDRLIESLAIHIREKVSSGKEYENEIAEKTKALAELISARAQIY